MIPPEVLNFLAAGTLWTLGVLIVGALYIFIMWVLPAAMADDWVKGPLISHLIILILALVIGSLAWFSGGKEDYEAKYEIHKVMNR